MIASVKDLLNSAIKNHYAIGAFNIYNFESIKAIISAAEEERSPVILQINPHSIEFGKTPFLKMCLSFAQESLVSVGIHIDRCSNREQVISCLGTGVNSIMVDGSILPFEENIVFTKEMTRIIHNQGGYVEGALGYIGTTKYYENKKMLPEFTDPEKSKEFVEMTSVDLLSVSVGNIVGHYNKDVHLDFNILKKIYTATKTPLVIHGASGLKDTIIKCCCKAGVCKFNFDTEIQDSYIGALRNSLQLTYREYKMLDLMNDSVNDIKMVVMNKFRVLGSSGRFQISTSY